MDNSIETEEILSNTLTPEEIKERPHVVPYRIDFPMDITGDNKCAVIITSAYRSCELISMAIGLTVFDEVSPLTFYIGNERIKEVFTLNINNDGYSILHKSCDLLNIGIGRRREVSLEGFLNENPPLIWFVDGSSLEGKYIVK